MFLTPPDCLINSWFGSFSLFAIGDFEMTRKGLTMLHKGLAAMDKVILSSCLTLFGYSTPLPLSALGSRHFFRTFFPF